VGKDPHNENLFNGGFMGLDNISIFDRSNLPKSITDQGISILQADTTAWIGKYCLDTLTCAVELAETRPEYEDIAVKFLEHFFYVDEWYLF